MFIHESPLLLPGLLAAQPEDKPIDPSPWRVNEEVLVREAGGELLLRQDSRTLRLRLTPLSGPLEGYAQDQTSIWVLARVKPNLISLRCARPSQSNSLERPLEIGVDQRVADVLELYRSALHALGAVMDGNGRLVVLTAALDEATTALATSPFELENLLPVLVNGRKASVLRACFRG